jgi:hypothetical protein
MKLDFFKNHIGFFKLARLHSKNLWVIVRFLGGWGVVTPPGYPAPLLSLFCGQRRVGGLRPARRADNAANLSQHFIQVRDRSIHDNRYL